MQYHQTDIVPVQTEIRFTTLILLPATESILEVTCGDKEFWPVNWNANLAYIKPAQPGSKTNLNLIAASGNVYSFLLTEIIRQRRRPCRSESICLSGGRIRHRRHE